MKGGRERRHERLVPSFLRGADPGVGPVDDAGCHVQIPSNASFDDLAFDDDDDDECDSIQRCHLPTMTDMLIAFPSQKGTGRRASSDDLHVLLQASRLFESLTWVAGT